MIKERQHGVGLWLQEQSVSWIAGQLQRSRQWVHKWICRYQRGGKTWFLEQSKRPHQLPRRVSPTFEGLVLRTQTRLRSRRNPLGYFGAEAIVNELLALGIRSLPSIRTIHRILIRPHRVIRKRRDRSRKGPPLPCPLAHRQNDVHQIDFIVGHYLSSQRPVVILNRKDVATGLVGGAVVPDRRVQRVLAFLVRDWEHHGAPRFLQMDNDMSLTGGHMHPRSLGQVIRLCLACRVVPIFTAERRPATNAGVERYNGLWQEKVWKRYRFRTLGQLQRRSLVFQDAYNTHLKQRMNRQESPAIVETDLRFLPPDLRLGHPLPFYRGQIWFIRRVNEQGHIQILNEPIRLPCGTPRNSSEWLFERAPRRSPYTGDRRRVRDSHASIIDLTNSVKRPEHLSCKLVQLLSVNDLLSCGTRNLCVTDVLSLVV